MHRLPIALAILAATVLIALPGALSQLLTQSRPSAVGGVMDLSDWDAAHDGPVPLNGDWDFYWNAFIDPARFAEEGAGAPPQSLAVPGTWNGLRVDGRPLPGQGQATYRLRLQLAAPADDLGLKFLDAATACRIFVNGRVVFTQGLPGEDRAASRPAYTPGVVRLPPLERSADIVIWVSNFDHRLAGLWEPVRLGRFADLAGEREARTGHQWFLFGAILIIGIYHLGLFTSRRRERAPLYFGLFCLAVAARSLTTGERIIMTLAPGLHWELLQKIEYISFYLCVPLFGLLIRALFGDICPRRAVAAVGAIALAVSAAALAAPVRIFSYTMAPFQWLTLALLVYGLAILGRAFGQRRPGALPLLIGFAALAAAGTNDILYSRLIIQSVYLLPLGLFVFIMCQALVLSNRYADAFNTLDRQRQDLETANRKLADEIRERTRAERAVKAERDTLDIITRSMGAGLLVIAPDHTIIWANSVIKGTYGDVEGTPCHTIFNRRNTVCPDCGIKAVFDNGKEMVVHEQAGKDAAGRPLWSEIIATPIRREDGSVAAALEMVVPITQRKQAEAALKESEERFRQLAENLREVVWMGEPGTGRFLYVSPAFETIWKQPVSAILADPQRWFASIHPDDADQVRASRVKHLLGNATTDEFRLLWPDGTIRWVINRTYPVTAPDGTISRFVGIAEDVTRRVALGQEKEDLERRLHHARRIETIATLAGGIAHQFNNALNVIVSGISLLELNPLDAAPGARENLSRMSQSAERMSALTGQLIAYAREGVSRQAPLAVGEQVERVLPLVRQGISADIALTTDHGPAMIVLADAAQLQIAVSAIVMNAAEAIGEGREGGRITISTARIGVARDGTWHGNPVTAGAYAEISIADNGAGMDAATLERIFEPFFSTKFQGRGLSMAAVYGIVSNHHGWLAVDSTPGAGTTVRILLPETAAPVPSVPQAPMPGPDADAAVLLVEDEVMVREVNCRLLTAIGRRVLAAQDAKSALAMAGEHQRDISMVLLDIHLPDMDGRDLLPRLKALLPQARIIVCSGAGTEGWDVAGAHGFLRKPFSLTDLKALFSAPETAG